ncbi:MAG: DUF1835 domain-containing protein [Gemmatimonadales bacterium]
MAGKRILHVTNGDSAAERIRAAGFDGEILVWRDVLHEGPVPGRLGFAQLREVRARFIAERGWAEEADVLAEQEARDATIDGCGECREVILWFEHDLFDQLQLTQILHRFATQGPDPDRLSLACEAEYIGMMSAERVRALHGRRVAVTREHVATAASAWSAFTAGEAARVSRLLDGDTSALPFLGAALRRHVEEFPAMRTGLSRSEQQALEAIQGGPIAMAEAFPRAHHQREDAVFLGDTVFAWYLERMSRVAVPLLLREGGEPVAAMREGEDRRDWWARRVRLTDAGRAVLEGRDNAVALNGIDRWLGGVHLEAPPGRPFMPPL